MLTVTAPTSEDALAMFRLIEQHDIERAVGDALGEIGAMDIIEDNEQ